MKISSVKHKFKAIFEGPNKKFASQKNNDRLKNPKISVSSFIQGRQGTGSSGPAGDGISCAKRLGGRLKRQLGRVQDLHGQFGKLGDVRMNSFPTAGPQGFEGLQLSTENFLVSKKHQPIFFRVGFFSDHL